MIFLWSFLFFAPGYLFFKRFFGQKEWDVVETAVLSFCILILFLFPFMMVGILCRLSMDLVWGSLLVLTAALWLFSRSKTPVSRLPRRSPERAAFAMALLFLGTLFWGWRGGLFTRDAFTFLAFIRKTAELKALSPNEPFYGDLHPDPVYGYNLWLFALGLFARVTSLDAAFLWRMAPFLLGPMALAAFYFLCRSFWKNQWVAVGGGFLFVFWYGFCQGGWIFRVIAYPNVAGNFLFLPIGLGLFFRSLSEKRRLWAVGAGFVGLLLAATHPFSFVLWGAGLTFFCLADLLCRGTKAWSQNAPSFAWALFPALPYLLFRAQFLEVTNPAYLTRIAPNDIHLSEHLFYKRPEILFCPEHYGPTPASCWNPLLAISFLLVPFLFRYRKDRRAVFLISNMVGPVLIHLNPWLVPLLCRIVHFDLVSRFGQLFPFLLVFLFFLDRFLSGKGEKGIVFLLVLTLPLSGLFRIGSPGPQGEFSCYSHLYDPQADRMEPLLKQFNRQTPKSAVVLAPSSIGLAVVAYTKHTIVSGEGIHVSPAARDQLEREEDVSAFFTHPWSQKEEFLLDKYGVDYVLIDKKILTPDRVESFLQKEAPFEPFLEWGDYAVLKRKQGSTGGG